ncbi:MAG: hypothetical protein JXA94_02265 [Parachlamydiales bacterium]|nr:hypothetical protein [Parachlamydiales bacterium]
MAATGAYARDIPKQVGDWLFGKEFHERTDLTLFKEDAGKLGEIFLEDGRVQDVYKDAKLHWDRRGPGWDKTGDLQGAFRCVKGSVYTNATGETVAQIAYDWAYKLNQDFTITEPQDIKIFTRAQRAFEELSNLYKKLKRPVVEQRYKSASEQLQLFIRKQKIQHHREFLGGLADMRMSEEQRAIFFQVYGGLLELQMKKDASPVDMRAQILAPAVRLLTEGREQARGRTGGVRIEEVEEFRDVPLGPQGGPSVGFSLLD